MRKSEVKSVCFVDKHGTAINPGDKIAIMTVSTKCAQLFVGTYVGLNDNGKVVYTVKVTRNQLCEKGTTTPIDYNKHPGWWMDTHKFDTIMVTKEVQGTLRNNQVVAVR